MTTEAVIFDIDGTLVDSNDAHTRAWMAAFATERIAVDYGSVRRAIGMGGDKLIPAVSTVDPESALGKRISERRAAEFAGAQLPGVTAFPHVRTLALRLVEDGYRLAIATSAKEDELRPLVERAGIADLLVAHSSSDAGASKPDPDIVQAALEGAKVGAEDAIMVGDTPYDVQAAQRAGVRIVALTCGGWSAADLKGAIAVYADPADLLARYEGSPFARR
ncbi:MAG TPA: HAD family hydrolase [Acetobacteraceae bacterium]|nr:HAD family hydrolase [Acetobacteraceae bacterium]